MSREILDLSELLDSYDTLKVNDKEYKVGSLTTETILNMDKMSREITILKEELDDLNEQLKEEGITKTKVKEIKAKIENLNTDIQLKNIEAIPEQIFVILKEYNPDIKIEEIKGWGLNAHLKFLEWFNQPFLGILGQTKTEVKKEKE